MNTIGENIKKRREELGLTQEELAIKLGYKSKSTINKIELGINDITLSKTTAFANALNTTESKLMGWDEEDLSIDNLPVNTIAAHFDGDDDYTDEEIRKIREFANFVRSQRK